MNTFQPSQINQDNLVNDVWAMFRAEDAVIAVTPLDKDAPQSLNALTPNFEIEILHKLEQRRTRAAEHLGISAAEVETLPFDLTALEERGIFLNVDATGFSVLSRQLDWQSLGITLPKEQAVCLSPPRVGLLPDAYRKRLLRAASGAHNALTRYSFRFSLCETVLGTSEYKWIPFTAFEAFEREFAAALETLAKAKASVIADYDEILESLIATFRELALDSANRLAATQAEPFDREEFVSTVTARAMSMIPSVAQIRDGMRIEMKPKVILLGSEIRAEQAKAAKLELEAATLNKSHAELEIELDAKRAIETIKVNAVTLEQEREQELKERIREIKIEAVKREVQQSVSPLKEGLEQLNTIIYEAAREMAERLNDAKFVPGGTAKRAREMCEWFKLMNFTGDAEIETLLADLNKAASRNAKTRTADEMKTALDAVVLATSKRARRLLKVEQLDALEL